MKPLIAFASIVVLALAACSSPTPAPEPAKEVVVPELAKLQAAAAQYAPTEIGADLSKLPANEQQALAKLVQAGWIMDGLFLRQAWAGNEGMLLNLLTDRSPLGQARTHFFLLNKGPWDRLAHNEPFIAGAPVKPEGANFYPAGATKADIEAWLKALPEAERARATGFFTTIRRSVATKGGKAGLEIVPYSVEYQGELARAADLLREAAALTAQPTLKAFLTSRADAFLSNDYYASDVAWMELDASIEPTIGPYEVYEDEWFNAKAGFEAFIAVRDDEETAKLAKLGAELQGIEDNLPIDAALRNPKLGGMAPIRVVNVVLAAGDGNRGVQTAAFNLPNDERVVKEKGAKRVMLRNIQEAKFKLVLTPIAAKVLNATQQKNVRFDAFFTHIVMHELMHGLGPHQIRVDGRDDDRSRAAEGDLQRDGGGQGRHLRPLRAAAADRQGRPRQVDAGNDVRYVPGVGVSIDPVRRERGARAGHRAPAQLAARLRRVHGEHGWGVRREPGEDQGRREGADGRDHDAPGGGRLCQGEGHAGAPRPGQARGEEGAGPAHGRAGGHRAELHDGSEAAGREVGPARCCATSARQAEASASPGCGTSGLSREPERHEVPVVARFVGFARRSADLASRASRRPGPRLVLQRRPCNPAERF